MHKRGILELEFDPVHTRLRKGHTLRDSLSAVVASGNTLWVANDEACSVERLTRLDTVDGRLFYSRHRPFALRDFLELPDGETEVDIEGMDIADGYLWLVGSHSLKRGKPAEGDKASRRREALSSISADGNRYLLARVPIQSDGDSPQLKRHIQDEGGIRSAARLNGDAGSNDLMQALAQDPHLAPFLALPGKDNGFDIEGLAVRGGRVFVGLRGPVLRGWAIILELAPVLRDNDEKTLKLRRIGEDGCRYRKHFLHLGGLGIRDLLIQGDDLLILAGPTMDLDGPVKVLRWQGGAAPQEEVVLDADGLLALGTIAAGCGEDHAEGMAFYPLDGEPAILVVYDAAADQRKIGTSSVSADLFALP